MHAFVPTLDHLADADLSDKGGVPDQYMVSMRTGIEDEYCKHLPISAGIKLLSVGEGSYVMNRDGV